MLRYVAEFYCHSHPCTNGDLGASNRIFVLGQELSKSVSCAGVQSSPRNSLRFIATRDIDSFLDRPWSVFPHGCDKGQMFTLSQQFYQEGGHFEKDVLLDHICAFLCATTPPPCIGGVAIDDGGMFRNPYIPAWHRGHRLEQNCSYFVLLPIALAAPCSTLDPHRMRIYWGKFGVATERVPRALPLVSQGHVWEGTVRLLADHTMGTERPGVLLQLLGHHGWWVALQ
mmetsp:Transcript_31001/g.65999  ORF Transcript_31001/g.65999 Transcript_31001/m.65999 type:complete len:227 (-) Transcript_31001:881-1561(-)